MGLLTKPTFNFLFSLPPEIRFNSHSFVPTFFSFYPHFFCGLQYSPPNFFICFSDNMGIKSRALRPFCATRVCVDPVNTHSHETFGETTVTEDDVQIMPRDEKTLQMMEIFFHKYLLFLTRGFLRSSDFPSPHLSSLLPSVALSEKRCWSVFLCTYNDQC